MFWSGWCCRPVVGLFEVDTLQVVEEDKDRVLREVIGQQGPPDGTVIVSMASGGEFTDEAVSEIMEKFTEFGEVIIVRYCDKWKHGSFGSVFVDI